jgi:hypothetical protein
LNGETIEIEIVVNFLNVIRVFYCGRLLILHGHIGKSLDLTVAMGNWLKLGIGRVKRFGYPFG